MAKIIWLVPKGMPWPGGFSASKGVSFTKRSVKALRLEQTSFLHPNKAQGAFSLYDSIETLFSWITGHCPVSVAGVTSSGKGWGWVLTSSCCWSQKFLCAIFRRGTCGPHNDSIYQCFSFSKFLTMHCPPLDLPFWSENRGYIRRGGNFSC